MMPEQRKSHLLGPRAYISIITGKRSLLLLDNDHIIIQNNFKIENTKASWSTASITSPRAIVLL